MKQDRSLIDAQAEKVLPPVVARSSLFHATGDWMTGILQTIPNIGRWTYVAAVTLVIGILMYAWISPFEGYYGWQADDWMTFRKSLRTAVDWRDAFTLRVNALQPYFFLYTYLPIALGLQVPSMDFPVYGPQTGMFRFVALMTIAFHGVFLAVWAWFAVVLTKNRLIALFSVVAVAASPALAVWMPQNETRYIGLPLVLIALGLVIKQLRGSDHALSFKIFFLAGLLCYIAFSLHYTSIYMALPVMVALGFASLLTVARPSSAAERIYWPWWRLPPTHKAEGRVSRFIKRTNGYMRRLAQAGMPRRIWVWFGFVLGFIAFAAVLEFVSYRFIGLPFSQGPLAGLAFQVDSHNVPGISHPLLALKVRFEYAKYAWQLVGPVMLFLITLGMVLLVLGRRQAAFAGKWLEWVVFASIVAAIAVVLASNGYPFFRKTLPMQPFMFLLAGVALMLVAHALTRTLPGGLRQIAFVLLFFGGMAAANHSALREHLQVRESHFAMGELVKAAKVAEASGRKVHWYMPRLETYSLRETVAQAHPDDLIATEFLFDFLDLEPATFFALRDTKPVLSTKRIWSTYALHAEHGHWIGYDLQNEPGMNDARLYRAGDLLATFNRGKDVKVVSATSSSQLGTQYRAQNVVDHDSMGHATSMWRSADITAQHWIELTFAEPVETDRIRLIGELFRPAPIRPDDIEIQVATGRADPLMSITRQAGHANFAIADVAFAKRSFTRMRIIIHASRRVSFGRIYRAVIEEIDIPGYRLTPVAFSNEGDRNEILEARMFDGGDPYDLHRYQHLMYLVDPEKAQRIEVKIKPNPRSIGEQIFLNGIALPTRYDRSNQTLVAVLPDGMSGQAGLAQFCLADLQVGGRLRQRLSDPTGIDRLFKDLCRGIRSDEPEDT
jgi:hypothetical protein